MASLTKTQIDRLGDRLREDRRAESDLKLLSEYRQSFASALEFVVRTIRERLHLRPAIRPAKSNESVIEKLRRETIRLSQIQDLAGCRLVVEDVADQDLVVATLRAEFPAASVVDRRVTPSHGYRAVHVIVEVEGRPVEIQVRTSLQHLWAEMSEKLADRFGAALKYGGGHRGVREVLNLASEVLAEQESRTYGPAEAVKHREMLTKTFRDMLSDLTNVEDEHP
jgi:putative GTP pyrophosphokinase